MADIRPLAFPPMRPAGQTAQSPARAEALQAARKAFFEAAMQQANVQPPPEPAKPAAAAAAAPMVTDTPTFQRFLRPGSRLDIKV